MKHSSTTTVNTKPSILVNIANHADKLQLPVIIGAAGLIIMLVWAGFFKMTVPGADGIVPLVTSSPLISWHFQVFGVYTGSDLIGLTEITSGVLTLIGLFRPKAGIVGSLIAIVIFFVTSSMVITAPGSLVAVGNMHYLSFMGLFLFKDVIGMGLSLFMLSHFGKKAAGRETK